MYLLIIILAAFFGLIQLFIIRDKFAQTILILQIISVAASFISEEIVITAGLYLYIFTIFLVIIYGFAKPGLNNSKRIFITVMGLAVLIKHIFDVFQWPYAFELGLLMVIPVVLYFVILFTNVRNYKNEIGFLTILAADALVQLLIALEYWT